MTILNVKLTSQTKRQINLCIVTVLIGIGSGCIGMLMALLIKVIQHLSYGLTPFTVISNESFLEIVRNAPSFRRMSVMTVCGLIAGLSWWALCLYGKPLVSIDKAVKANTLMPGWTTILNGLLQIITIGMGSPLGRERAPREVGVVLAQWISAKAGLSVKDTKIMAACGAGASFAAIYNVPFTGGIYVLEALLVTMDWRVSLPAFTSSVIAVLISWLGLGNMLQYQVVNHAFTPSFFLWAGLSGPIFGLGAYWFIRVANKVSKDAPKNIKLPILSLLNYMMIGSLAIYLPALLGNGKSPVQLEFSDSIGVGLSFLLLILRLLIIFTSLRTGSHGGLLTPSLANGALLGVLLGGCWNLFCPSTAFNNYAIVGASAFLAAAQKIPITAIIMMFELMHMRLGFLMPILIAVIGAFSSQYLCSRYFGNPQ